MATRSAENPVGVVARKLHIGGVAKEAPRLSLPGKLVFPSIHNGRFSMLGLGDIVSYFLIFYLLLSILVNNFPILFTISGYAWPITVFRDAV